MRRVGNPGPAAAVLLNDVHARLNPTRVAELVTPRSVAEVVAAVQRAAVVGLPVSVCGGRSADAQPVRARLLDFRAHRVALIYSTVRVIRKDDETFLPWAAGDRACVVFNLHVQHDADGLAKARRDFRRIDRALERGGSFYLTYHRWATPAQMVAGHPRFVDFLRAKRVADPEERFQSEWYRQWRGLLPEGR